ncbi:MAG: hypothetical protein ACI8UO_003337 [Verrucomicrobiales bacterium]|jgi:hypothetical protein
MNSLAIRIPIVLIATAIGGAIGHHAFILILREGFYALILPGLGVGLGASFARNPSKILALVLGLEALVLGLFSEWIRLREFTNFDADFFYFVMNSQNLKGFIWLMIAVGGIVAWWLAWTSALASRAKTTS